MAEPEIDVDFDPNNAEELREFIEQFRQLSEDERLDVYASLSAEQQTAVDAALTPDQLEVSIKSADDTGPDVFAAADSKTTETVEVSAESTLGFHLWDWYLQVSWEHNGSFVSNVEHDDYADIDDSTWSYDGTASTKDDIDYDEFEVFRQGSLTYLGGTFNATPHARVTGDAYGNFEVLESDNGT